MSENAKSILKMLRPEDVWQPKVGAPFKNRNSLKTGRHTAKAKNNRAVVREFRGRAKLLITAVEAEIARMELSEESRRPMVHEK